jgi:flagellar protein FliO/FliZ
MTVGDPETISWARIILAFAVVFTLLVGLGFVLKFVKERGLKMPGMDSRTPRRLQVIETLPLDIKRRLVIVRCDDNEHLLLLGPDQDIVVETRLNENQPSSRLKSIA